MNMNHPCEHCPWRKSNQGKRTPWGFYKLANLRRLWNQIRGGGAAQSCHPTDPSHPDHVAAGAKPGATPRECPGSVILVLREFAALQKIAAERGSDTIDAQDTKTYLKRRKKGLKRSGLVYWLVSRYQLGGVPVVGGPKLPDVDMDDQAVGFPAAMEITTDA